jgi:hypothetical protein
VVQVDGSTGHGNAATTKRCGLVFQGRPLADTKGGRGIVKHLHLAIFCVARAKCGVLETDCSRTALFRISNSEPTMFEFSQVMRASLLTSSPVVYPDYYSTLYDQTAALDSDYGSATCPKEEEEIIVIPEKFRHVFYGYNDEHVFVNMTDVEPNVVTNQLAMDGMPMKSSHIGIKTYYVYDQSDQ